MFRIPPTTQPRAPLRILCFADKPPRSFNSKATDDVVKKAMDKYKTQPPPPRSKPPPPPPSPSKTKSSPATTSSESDTPSNDRTKPRPSQSKRKPPPVTAKTPPKPRPPPRPSLLGNLVASDPKIFIVTIHQERARFFQSGRPMVYPDAILKTHPPQLETGSVVAIKDENGAVLGWGVWNSVSLYRVRILQTTSDVEADQGCVAFDIKQLVTRRMEQAVALRETLGLLPPSLSLTTNVFRLVNSEGDRLSGLIVDVLGSVAVVQSSAAWIESVRDVVEECVKRSAGVTSVEWKRVEAMMDLEGLGDKKALEQEQEGDGLLDAMQEEEGEEEDGEEEAVMEEEETVMDIRLEASPPSPPQPTSPTPVDPSSWEQVTEAGIKYWANPHGQKTGFYSDQRSNRLFLRSMSHGRRVLDLCCYSGGFALNAFVGGASFVRGVDSSAEAVALARENISLNRLDSARIEFHQQRIEDYMRDALQRDELYDIVILDPPKLAPNQNALRRALFKYTALNQSAMKLVRPGGLLMSCSCSGAVSQRPGTLENVIADAALRARRRATILRSAGAAPDHVLDHEYPEGQYLTNITVRVL